MASLSMSKGPKPEQSKSFTPTAAGSTVTPDAGFTLASVVVNGDADLISANIKAGITLFGIAGNSNVVDTSSGTATAAQILSGLKAWVDGVEITGSIASKGAATYTPGTSNQTIAAGQYLSGVQTISGDADLVAANIAEGISLFGISGTHGAFLAGTNIIAASDNAVSNNIGYGVYTKKKEAQIKKAGTYRISFQLATGNEAYFAKARIYKNGTAVGTLRTTYSTTWVEYTEDITFTLNDYCQLYLCSEYDGTDSLTRFFRIGISLIYAIPIITM